MRKFIGFGLAKTLGATFSVALLVTSFAVAAQRHPGEDKPDKSEKHSRAVPEISAYGAPTGLALVIGGVAVVLGRRTRRTRIQPER
jgi:hypothetical protein